MLSMNTSNISPFTHQTKNGIPLFKVPEWPQFRHKVKDKETKKVKKVTRTGLNKNGYVLCHLEGGQVVNIATKNIRKLNKANRLRLKGF